MGRLVNGAWRNDGYDTAATGGRFLRSTTAFRNWITPDGAPGPSGEGGFPAASARCPLHVSLACPWAQRRLIFRALKGLAPHVSVDVVHPDMLDDGWTFATDFPGATGDRVMGKRFLRALYLAADPGSSDRVTAPIRWDELRGTVVANESSELIRMFNSAFDGVTGNREDHWPEDLHGAIEPVDARICATVDNGVCRAGFATTQGAYDEAVGALFDRRDRLEDRLSRNRWLMGDRLTRGRPTPAAHAAALRHGLSRAFQVQPAQAGGLPGPVGLDPGTLPAAGGGADDRFRPHHPSRPLQPRDPQSAPDRARPER